MLSKGDKESIREMIREEFKEALFRKITIEKKATGPGEVDGNIETSTENMLDMLVVALPQWQQSMGLMEGEVTKNTDAVSRITGLLGSLQESFMVMAKFVVTLQEMGIMDTIEEELKPIEITDETNTG